VVFCQYFLAVTIFSLDRWLNKNNKNTQNNNKSFNSTVWAMAPKTTSSGKTILDIVTHIAVCVYNDGMTPIMKIMQTLGIKIGANCYNFCTEANERRVFG